ncbi:MAG: SLC13 family permease [Bacteroidales bacterium]|nr:SLC13 family permease [Bacteroidales bacterium]
MLSFDLILVFIIILFILISLYWGVLGPSFTFVIGISILGIFGVLTPQEILSGFANEQIAVVLMLLLIGDIIRQTALVEVIFDRIFRHAKSYNGFMNRMVILISVFSAFLNNTPLVAVMMPYVNSWCKRKKISPSKFLMPLSFAAILGGTATLIGTSTNLIVNGLIEDQTIIPGLEPLKIFDFTAVGATMVVIGFFYIWFFGNKLLPNYPVENSEKLSSQRRYIIEAKVRTGSHLSGKTIKDTGFVGEQSFTLVEIIRADVKVKKFSELFTLAEEDILVFTGDTDAIAEMIERKSGLQLPEVGMMSKRKKTEVLEIVISQNSSLIGKTVKMANFRSKYDAAIIAVHRNGVLLEDKLNTIMLRAGDVLLLFAGDDFLNRSEKSMDFYFITKVRGFVKMEWYKPVVLFGGLFLAIILSAFGLIKLFTGLTVVIIASLALKITSPKDLSRSIDYNLAIIIVLSLALGIAMIKSGAADLIAETIISLFMPYGTIGVLFGIYFITTILAAYITSKASAAIIFPIALTMSANLGLDPIPFVLIVAFASAANFMTPIGFQTNLMVFGPGNYKFIDFLKLGGPLTILYMVVTVLMLYLIYLQP